MWKLCIYQWIDPSCFLWIRGGNGIICNKLIALNHMKNTFAFVASQSTILSHFIDIFYYQTDIGPRGSTSIFLKQECENETCKLIDLNFSYRKKNKNQTNDRRIWVLYPNEKLCSTLRYSHFLFFLVPSCQGVISFDNFEFR